MEPAVAVPAVDQLTGGRDEEQLVAFGDGREQAVEVAGLDGLHVHVERLPQAEPGGVDPRLLSGEPRNLMEEEKRQDESAGFHGSLAP